MYKQPYEVLIFGGIIIDRYIVVDKYPQPGQDTFINNEFEKIGGCAINVAYTLKNLETEPCLVSAIGSDESGDKIRAYLSEKELESPGIKQLGGQNTGFCLTVLDSSGERTFFSKRGCDSVFLPEMLNKSQIGSIKYAYVTGYYLLNDSSREDVVQALIQLTKRGCKILFDPGPLVDQINRDTLSFVLTLATIITPNTDEAHKIALRLQIKESFHEWCFGRGIQVVAMKKGGGGTDVFMKNHEVHIPAYHAEVLDTSGAGDSFAGGVIAGLIHGYNFEESVKIGSACGAITTTINGPHGDFSWNQVMDTMEKKKVWL